MDAPSSSSFNRFETEEGYVLRATEVFHSVSDDEDEMALSRAALVVEIDTRSTSKLLKLLTEKMNLNEYEVCIDLCHLVCGQIMLP